MSNFNHGKNPRNYICNTYVNKINIGEVYNK